MVILTILTTDLKNSNKIKNKFIGTLLDIYNSLTVKFHII